MCNLFQPTHDVGFIIDFLIPVLIGISLIHSERVHVQWSRKSVKTVRIRKEWFRDLKDVPLFYDVLVVWEEVTCLFWKWLSCRVPYDLLNLVLTFVLLALCTLKRLCAWPTYHFDRLRLNNWWRRLLHHLDFEPLWFWQGAIWWTLQFSRTLVVLNAFTGFLQDLISLLFLPLFKHPLDNPFTAPLQGMPFDLVEVFGGLHTHALCFIYDSLAHLSLMRSSCPLALNFWLI